MHSKWFVGKIYFTVLVAVFCCGYHAGTPPGVRAASADMPSSLQGTIRVSGAWALYPMMVKWAEEFKKVYPQVRIDLSAGGAGKGITDALSGLVDIGMVSRELRPEEIDQKAFYIPVVKDAVFQPSMPAIRSSKNFYKKG